MTLILWRYIWRGLWFNKTRTVLVVLAIAIGLLAFGAIAGAANTLNRELPINYSAVNPANITLHTSFVDDKQVDALQRMPQVADAEGRHRSIIRYQKVSGEWADLQLFSLDDYAASQINKVYPQSGTWPPIERQFLIERNSLPLLDSASKEWLTVEGPHETIRTAPIVGLLHDMNQPPAQITGVPYAYVTRDTLEWLGLSENYNEVHLVISGDATDRAYVEGIAQDATDKVERAGGTVFWTELIDPSQHFSQEFLPTILIILGILGVLALILSGFLVINVITAILTQQQRQIGVMKAMGARTDQIVRLYLIMVAFLGSIALVMAVPLGALGAQVFSRFVAGQLNFDINSFEISPIILALELVVGLLAPVLAALIPVLGSARITVREAIQDTGLEQNSGASQSLTARLQSIQERLRVSRPLGISLRNTFRRQGRLARTLVPLMLGGAIFMSVLSLRASLFNTLEETLTSQGFDVQIQLDQPYNIARIAQIVTPVEGIAALESWDLRQGIHIYPDGTEGDDLRLYALPIDTQIFEPNLVQGRWLEPTDHRGVIVPSGLLASEPTVSLGAKMTIKIGDEENRWEVIGVNQAFQPPIAPSVLYVNQQDFWQVAGYHKQVDTVRIITEEHDSDTLSTVAQSVEKRLNQAGMEVRSTRTAAEDRTIFTERFNIITVILMMMAFLLATVGSLGLMATMSINVLERRREIGVMRAIGASDRSVLQIYIVEGALIGLLSWGGALLLSQPMSRLMSWRIGMTFAKLPLSYLFDLSAPLLWLVIVVAVSSLASLIPARNAASLSVRETLAYE
ncbi:MAG: FtsX-like permease family protein [Chloroflexota bacterium]